MLVSYIELDPFFANWTLPGCFLQLVLSLAWFFWKLWCWSWNSNTLATWCEELTHLKRLWCWERLRAGGLGHDRGWDGWVASPTQWTWIWVNSGSWWWTGRPGVLRFMGFQSQTRLSEWTELNWSQFACKAEQQIHSWIFTVKWVFPKFIAQLANISSLFKTHSSNHFF